MAVKVPLKASEVGLSESAEELDFSIQDRDGDKLSRPLK